MARTTGPLMSMSASGSLAKTLTYAHWKGRPYVRQLVTPANPQSAGQKYTRAMMKFLSQAWASLSPTPQSSWDALAKQGNFSPFNAYIRANMMRWTQALAPGEATPIGGTGTNDTVSIAAPVGGVGQISMVLTMTTKHNSWAVAIVVDPTNSATPGIQLTQLITDISDMIATNTRTILITGLDPGTYSVDKFLFTEDGLLGGAIGASQGIVVT